MGTLNFTLKTDWVKASLITQGKLNSDSFEELVLSVHLYVDLQITTRSPGLCRRRLFPAEPSHWSQTHCVFCCCCRFGFLRQVFCV